MRLYITKEGMNWLRKHPDDKGVITSFINQVKKIHGKDFETRKDITEWIKSNINLKDCETDLPEENFEVVSVYRNLESYRLVIVFDIRDEVIHIQSNEIIRIFNEYLGKAGAVRLSGNEWCFEEKNKGRIELIPGGRYEVTGKVKE